MVLKKFFYKFLFENQGEEGTKMLKLELLQIHEILQKFEFFFRQFLFHFVI